MEIGTYPKTIGYQFFHDGNKIKVKDSKLGKEVKCHWVGMEEF